MQLPNSRLLPLLAALALGLATAASFPALRGFPVYDDVYLPRGELADEPADVGRTFSQTSLTYRRAVARNESGIGGVTYRPTTASTLVATEWLAPGMRSHHLVSLLLHALTAFLVGLAVVRAGRPAWLAALATGLVAAHPATIEAWVWVAGRADLLAGLCVAVVALAIPADPAKATRGGYVVAAIALLVGSLAKETFVFVGPVVALRGALAPGASAATRRASAALLVVPLLALVAIGMKVAPDTTVIPDPADLAAWLRRTPRMIGDSALSLLLPLPRVMSSLAYETSTRVPTTTLIGCVVFGLGFAACSSRSRVALALVFLGIVATLCVSAHVADRLWLGFDRFLYAPLVALAILVPEALEATTASEPPFDARVLAALLALGLAGLAVSSHLSARAYAGQLNFERALRRARPSDPTAQLLESKRMIEAGHEEVAADLVAHAPRSRSPAIEHERAVRQLQIGEFDDSRATIRNAFHANPNDASLAADAIALAMSRRDYAELAALAEVANTRPASRRSACFGLSSDPSKFPRERSSYRATWEEAKQILRCDRVRRQ